MSCKYAKELALGMPRLLPKVKGPGVKWQLVIDKCRTPTNRILSLACRAMEAALNSMPRPWWSDCKSVQEVVTLSNNCNKHLRALFANNFDCLCLTVSADMQDCFHHLPCESAPGIRRNLTAYWNSYGKHSVSDCIWPGSSWQI